MAKILIGIDFGGTNLKIGCFDENLNLLARDSVPTQINAGPVAVVEKIGNAANGGKSNVRAAYCFPSSCFREC